MSESMVERAKTALADAFAKRFGKDIDGNDAEALVIAVIGALREPTEAMLEAGHSAVYDCYSLEPGEGFDDHPGEAAWRAMVDAAIMVPA